MKWYAKPKYGYTTDEIGGQTNAANIRDFLLNKNWQLISVCAAIGNGAGEGGLNPWRWESDNVPTYDQFIEWGDSLSHGYGIFGITPANRYINNSSAGKYPGYAPNFSDRPGKTSDGDAQMLFFINDVKTNWVTSKNTVLYKPYKAAFADIGINMDDFYGITFSEFIAGVRNGTSIPMNHLVGAFETSYEKPSAKYVASSYPYRVEQGNKWYEYFTGLPPTPVTGRKLPLIYYINQFL